MTRKSASGILATVLVVLCAVCIHGCGEEREKDVCEKAMDVQKGHCKGFEHCIPCKCVVENQVWHVVLTENGTFDLENSYCETPGPCESSRLENAEICLDDEEACDPCEVAGARICGNPDLPELCPF